MSDTTGKFRVGDEVTGGQDALKILAGPFTDTKVNVVRYVCSNDAGEIFFLSEYYLTLAPIIWAPRQAKEIWKWACDADTPSVAGNPDTRKRLEKILGISRTRGRER